MKLRTGFTLLLSLVFAGSVMAIPALPGLRKIKQPDGTEITVKLCGDERLNWFETEDGYKLLRNSEDYLVYAVNDSNGDLVPSSLVYGIPKTDSAARRAALKITKDAKFSPAQLESAMQKMPKINEAIFPKEGKCNLLLILVNFSDTETTISKEFVKNMMNEEGYNGIGSFRDFILEASNNKLDITTTVTDWIQISKKHDYFNANLGDRCDELIVEALKLADKDIDFSKFDNNKDGYVDGVMILHQGLGQESSNDKRDIWSHSYQLRHYGVPASERTFDGVVVDSYTIEPERIKKTDNTGIVNTTIGVFCHEFTHNLGAPDYYDSDGEKGGGNFIGTGNWDLMASGSWNGNLGDRPAMPNAFQRIRFGWINEPIELTEDIEINNFINTTESKTTYKITTSENYDYFLLENRQQSKSNFDQALPGSGLLIYHVNENYFTRHLYTNVINSTTEQSVYIVAANASIEPNASPGSYGLINNKDAIFGNGYNGLNQYTTPGPYSWKDKLANGGIYYITNNADGIVSFSFFKDKTFDIENISGKGNRGNYKILIDGPEIDGNTFKQYDIYINDKKTGSSIKNGNSIDLNISTLKGSYKYSFELVYDNGTVGEKKDFTVFFPEECLLTVEAINNGQSNTINWTVDESKKNGQEAEFVEFRIYRNNELIGKTTSNTFTDNSPLEKATYTVVSAWENDVELKGLTTENVTDIESVNTISNNIFAYYDSQESSFVCSILSENNKANATVEVFSTLGHKIASESAEISEGLNSVTLNCGNISDNGVYILVVTLENNKTVEKVSRKVVVTK